MPAMSLLVQGLSLWGIHLQFVEATMLAICRLPGPFTQQYTDDPGSALVSVLRQEMMQVSWLNDVSRVKGFLQA